MAHTFDLNPEALKRQFAVYVVIATDCLSCDLYVGKTGDNREGCIQLISRCGNHFSYNKIHSQIRNKLADHENKHYTYVFDHFGDYLECSETRRPLIDMINEMERCLNQRIAKLVQGMDSCILHNQYKGSWVSKSEKERRAIHRTPDNMAKIEHIVEAVNEKINKAVHRAGECGVN